MRSNDAKVAAVLVLSLLLGIAGCGGGGGGGGTEGTGGAPASTPSVPNQAPLADAGASQNVLMGNGPVQLDGSRSADPEGAPLQYAWTFVLTPGGSAATLSDAGSAHASFTPDKTGLYRVRLAVSDGSLQATGSADIDVAVNPASTANAGPDQLVNRAASVTLDGSASSDPLSRSLSYTWTQVANGCPDVTAGIGTLAGVRPTFTAPEAVCTLAFVLRVNNGSADSFGSTVRVLVLEDAAHAIFVNGASGKDDNPGTPASPKATIAAALGASIQGGAGADIYVSNTKTYAFCTQGLAPGVSLYGGYDANWERSGGRSLLSASCPAGLAGGGLANQTLSGLKIVTANGAAPGDSSYAMRLNLAGNVVIADNEISAGTGAGGAPGATAPTARPGIGGTPGAFGSCDSSVDIPGGPGGAGAVAGATGGAGGAGGRAVDGASGNPGTGSFSGPGGRGGAVGNPGLPGANGGNGSNGSAGISGTAVAGAFAAVYFANAGGAGASGAPGSGGGGGGGGGGKSFLFFAGTGNGGGGGGGGGEGGRGGSGGQGGGGSFGLYLTGTGTVQLSGNTITAGNGGAGGGGAPGAPGGPSGAGASGGSACASDIGAGGKGGSGGSGGRGGSAAGGSGGPSMGVAHSVAVSVVDKDNTFTLGAGGAGGPGAAIGASGASAPVFGF